MNRGRGIRGRGRGRNRVPIPENNITEQTNTSKIDLSVDRALDVTAAAQAAEKEAERARHEPLPIPDETRRCSYPANIKHVGIDNAMTQVDCRVSFQTKGHIPHLHLRLAISLNRTDEGAAIYSFPETMFFRLNHEAVKKMILTKISPRIYSDETKKNVRETHLYFRMDLELLAKAMVMERVMVEQPYELLKGLVNTIFNNLRGLVKL